MAPPPDAGVDDGDTSAAPRPQTGFGFILAGGGGLADGARTSHEGRRAVLLTRQSGTEEFASIAETMGIEIIEEVYQSGSDDPRGYLGSGRLEMIGTDLHASRVLASHPWHGVDLVLVHHNLTPRQIVNVHDDLQMECWDRVRLMMELFTQHASSAEARTQVRIARLAADRSVLREIVRRETTGERLGFGAGGRHAWRAVLETVNREMGSLRRRQRKHATSMSERRRQRARSGALSVGLAGYTNAGKSSLFRALCGKDVLVQDRLFSTLETTVGRMLRGPRVLMVDTIGFLDDLPSELLDAFKATLAESLECDLLLLIADCSDSTPELKRRLNTSRRELFDRLDDDSSPQIIVVLTKSDLASKQQKKAASDLVESLALHTPYILSSVTGDGMDGLRDGILRSLYGKPLRLQLLPATGEGHAEIAEIRAACHQQGVVIEENEQEGDSTELLLWLDEATAARLFTRFPDQLVPVEQQGEQ